MKVNINAVVKRILPVIVISQLCFTCYKEKGEHEFIMFVNNSDTTVYVSEKWQKNMTDTLWGGELGREVLKGDTIFFEPAPHLYWETVFESTCAVRYFVFSPDSFYVLDEEGYQLFLYPLREIVNRYQVKSYQLREEDLDNLNWIIVYP